MGDGTRWQESVTSSTVPNRYIATVWELELRDFAKSWAALVERADWTERRLLVAPLERLHAGNRWQFARGSEGKTTADDVTKEPRFKRLI